MRAAPLAANLATFREALRWMYAVTCGSPNARLTRSRLNCTFSAMSVISIAGSDNNKSTAWRTHDGGFRIFGSRAVGNAGDGAGVIGGGASCLSSLIRARSALSQREAAPSPYTDFAAHFPRGFFCAPPGRHPAASEREH